MAYFLGRVVIKDENTVNIDLCKALESKGVRLRLTDSNWLGKENYGIVGWLTEDNEKFVEATFPFFKEEGYCNTIEEHREGLEDECYCDGIMFIPRCNVEIIEKLSD